MDKSKAVIRRGVRAGDPEIVKDIIESTGFFYHFEIPVAVELVQAALDEGEEESGYLFLFAEVEGRTVAYSCFGTIAGTEHGYDLFWIATHADFRGSGIGKILLEATHDEVRSRGADYIIAETSSIDKYLPTRLFYEKNDYAKEAFIRDYYKMGDGKVIYVKRFR
jgi:ribosomal protein S18 acetylase RimI-like enzyme